MKRQRQIGRQRQINILQVQTKKEEIEIEIEKCLGRVKIVYIFDILKEEGQEVRLIRFLVYSLVCKLGNLGKDNGEKEYISKMIIFNFCEEYQVSLVFFVLLGL